MLDSIRLPLTALGFVTTAVLLSPSSARAQGDDEAEFDRTPRKCVSTPRVRKTEILDDRTIIFYMRGNKEIYRNYLPRDCPGLERNDRFAYATQGTQLCSIDVITVLEQSAFGLDPRFTCKLGVFIPITQEEVEDLKLEQENETPKRNSISSERAELPPEGAAPADTPAADESAPVEAPPPAEPPKRARRGSGVTAR